MANTRTRGIGPRIIELWAVFGSIKRVAEEVSCSRGTVQYHLKKHGLTKPLAEGFKEGQIKTKAVPLPKEGVKRYILTSAQNNTRLHQEVFSNLLALKKHFGDCELWISRFTYNLSAYKAQPVKPGEEKNTTDPAVWYTPEIEPYVNDERTQIAPGLVWCGEMNILPTRSRPLSGFETYTGRQSGIFPHAKMAMESIASGKYEATKFNYTTGTVTQMNYLARAVGHKAEHHHTYGALLVEVTPDGEWWCRQLNADNSGDIYDLTLKVSKGVVYKNQSVEAINWGDIHEEQLDPVIRELAWGKRQMLDTLRPKFQFMHDTISFVRRNHHDSKDPHKRFKIHIEGRDSVEEEVKGSADFLSKESYRPWCQTVVVKSNHDNALEKWLREADYRSDPPNALFFLRCQLMMYEQIASGNDDFLIFEWACRQAGVSKDIRFLREDESFVICRDIECGMHGHNGPNGARGTPHNLSRMGRKANTGHTHKAGIFDGLYVAGMCAQTDLGYNLGPGSSSHSHIVTYPNGKRAIVTMYGGKWRA